MAHELGHFLLAKRTGMAVREFSLGFGPRLGGWKRGGTVYSVRLFPIGGFTLVEGTEPDEPLTETSYATKTVGQRAAMIAAGPLMNFALTIVLFASLFIAYGVPADVNQASTVLGEVIPGYPADKAGLLPGDRLISVDGQTLATWTDFDEYVAARTGQPVTIVYARGAEERTVTVTPVADPETPGEGMIGVAPTIIFKRVGFLKAIGLGFSETWQVLVAWLGTLVGFITRRIPVDLAGPVMTVRFIGTTARSGLANLLYLAGFLSLNIGLFNLLPLPALDGGRLGFLGYEAVSGRKVDPRKESVVHFIGFAALILLMVLVTYRDLLRL